MQLTKLTPKKLLNKTLKFLQIQFIHKTGDAPKKKHNLNKKWY